jgi:hypothetical protein
MTSGGGEKIGGKSLTLTYEDKMLAKKQKA